MTLVHEGLEWRDFSTPADTYLAPIPGVDAEVPYTVRGVTVDGDILYEITDKAAIKGKNITEKANIIPGYEVVLQYEKTITITDDPLKNVFEFYYQLVVPSPPIEPSESPTGEPTDEPAEPTDEPVQPTDEPMEPPASTSPPESPDPSLMP